MLNNDKCGLVDLHQAGFGELAIARLQRLRRMYLAQRDQRESLAQYHRLHFVRWLVRTGKLTEQVTEAS
jgi:hypothetical protein